MLFLGNYVDHGDHQLDVICLLLLLVVRHPSSYFLLRGKHESRKINGQLVGRTLATACKRCFAPGDWTSLWSLFNNLFDRMPFEAVVDGRYYCASQGLATGMPTAVAQALEDSNDDGSEKVSYYDAVSVRMRQTTHVQYVSLHGGTTRAHCLACSRNALHSWYCKAGGFSKKLSQDASRIASRQ